MNKGQSCTKASTYDKPFGVGGGGFPVGTGFGTPVREARKAPLALDMKVSFRVVVCNFGFDENIRPYQQLVSVRTQA